LFAPQLTPQGIVLTVLLFFILVTIHEWGHYYFAKRAGILVREFAIGFGPKLFSIRRGETQYTIRLLPLGGYVRMAGEDPENIQIQQGQTIAIEQSEGWIHKLYLDKLDERVGCLRGEVVTIDLERSLKVELMIDNEHKNYQVSPQAVIVARNRETQIAPWNRQFGAKSVGKRAMTIFAGPLMNILLAAVLFISFAFISGVPTGVAVNEVIANEPASRAGLQPGDIIKKINGVEIGPDASRISQIVTLSADQEMNWIIIRNGQELPLKVTPAKISDNGKEMVRVGVRMEPVTRPATFSEGIVNGFDTMWISTVNIMQGFQKLILGQFTLDDLGGPIRIAEMTMQIANAGILYYTWWAAMLSLYLAIFNLLPIPALDGSRLIFLGIEAIRGKPVHPNRESLVHFIGFAMLMLLMVAVTFNDIMRLFRG
jgi:regulator of sigma E protease